jgi:signal transduction histidine kinase
MTSYKKLILGFGTLHLLLVVFIILTIFKNDLQADINKDQLPASYIIKKSSLPVEKEKNLPVIDGNPGTFMFLLALLVGLFPFFLFTTVIVKKIKKNRSKQNDLIGKNKNRELFFSIISHDLKTPSQQLIGLSEMILSEEKLKEEEYKRINRLINVCAKRQYELLNNLLAWSTSRFHGKEIHETDCNLKELLEEQLSGQKEMIEEKELIVVNTIPPDITLYCNENLLGTVLRNVLTNAIKFTSKGGTVHLNPIITKRELAIQIKDTGVGMKQETIENLFDLKYIRSMRGTHKETGSGIGLILCKEIIEKMKGTISVSSKENEGTCVVIKLPYDHK